MCHMHQYQPPWGKKYGYITYWLISSKTIKDTTDSLQKLLSFR